MSARTLFDKVWERHVVVPESAETPVILAIDLHLVHEVTSPQAFTELRRRGIRVRRPERTLATMDHSTPTTPDRLRSLQTFDARAYHQLQTLKANCDEFGIRLFDLESDQRGIVHVIGPELGATHPGATIVCGDSHTSTHGAFGALAFGIGTTEVGHVLASQCLLQRKPGTLSIEINGTLADGVTAKDLILHVIREIGVSGGTGHVIEYRGDAIRSLSMDGRMTVCNMSIEAGARAGMIAPDQTTFDYLEHRPLAPAGDAWLAALDDWRGLQTDEGATFDRVVRINADEIRPMVTFGTNPAMATAVGAPIPTHDDQTFRDALRYMDLEPGRTLDTLPIDVVFIGSCTNARLSDLRLAAELLSGHTVSPKVRMLVVPGSQQVKRDAEAEGLARIFTEAGAEWLEPGCSMCIAMNGDRVDAGSYAISTSNRNFEGRQGKGARTLLASPLTAAASAITGRVTDPREITAPSAAWN